MNNLLDFHRLQKVVKKNNKNAHFKKMATEIKFALIYVLAKEKF